MDARTGESGAILGVSAHKSGTVAVRSSEPADALAHPAVAALIEMLPQPGQPWSREELRLWNEALMAVLQLLHKQ